MKKIKIYLVSVIMFALPILLQAQYMGGNGRGDVSLATLNNILTNTENNNNVIPSMYSLHQNYPNPFNPVTRIKFEIPKSSFVNFTVYDILGREVAKLVNDNLKAGTYIYDWNASQYPTGMYFYKLTADNFTDVKKMVLIK